MMTRLALFLILLAQLAPGLSLAAKKRVVVLPFAGPSADAARGGVAAAIGRKATQVPPGKFSAAAEQLGADVNAAAGMVRTCSQVRCDAVIQGTIRKKGRRFTLTVTVYDGRTGEPIGKRAATVRGPRRVAAAGAAVGAQCLALVAKGSHVKAGARPAVAQPAPKAVEPPPPPKVAGKGDSSDVPIYKSDGAEPEEPSGKGKRGKKKDDEEGGDDGVSKRASGGGGGLAGLFDLSFAAGFSLRTCSVTAADPSKNMKYEGGMYPEFTLRADFYPMTFFVKNFARNFGFDISYTRHLTISTKAEDPGAPEVGTSSWELLFDLNLRWAFWDKPTSPVVLPFVGWGIRTFWLDDNNVLPTMSYRFVRFGLDGRVPLGTPYAALHAGFDVRVYTGGLADARYNLGERSGGLGYSVRGGAYGRFPFGLFYFLDVEYLRFNTEFDGLPPSTQLQDQRDRLVPTSGTDSYLRFWLGAGYAL